MPDGLDGCTPLDTPINVVWNGVTIHSCTGGFQGCPIMSLCHVVVQRAVPDALGLADLLPGTHHLIPPLEPRPPAAAGCAAECGGKAPADLTPAAQVLQGRLSGKSLVDARKFARDHCLPMSSWDA